VASDSTNFCDHSTRAKRTDSRHIKNQFFIHFFEFLIHFPKVNFLFVF